MNELTHILAETVERLFRELMADGMPPFSDRAVFEQLWRAVEELGITNLFLTEDRGGFDGGWQDAFPVFKQLGRHAVPLPVGETIIAKRLLQRRNMLVPASAITIGTASNVTIQHDDHSRQWLFSGDVPSLPWGQTAPSALIHCNSNHQCHYVLLSTAQAASSTGSVNEADEPRDTLHFSDAPIIDSTVIDSDQHELVTAAALLRACQTAGALEAALELCVHYVQERKQFGRPIGKFQAIQHQLALLAEHCAAVSCAAQSACLAYDNGDAGFEIAAAKLRANRAVGECTSIAHQVHGAIGFTREHRLHYYTQRLWSWRSEFGNDRHWAGLLGKLVVQMGEAQLWANLTARSDARG